MYIKFFGNFVLKTGTLRAMNVDGSAVSFAVFQTCIQEYEILVPSFLTAIRLSG